MRPDLLGPRSRLRENQRGCRRLLRSSTLLRLVGFTNGRGLLLAGDGIVVTVNVRSVTNVLDRTNYKFSVVNTDGYKHVLNVFVSHAFVFPTAA